MQIKYFEECTNTQNYVLAVRRQEHKWKRKKKWVSERERDRVIRKVHDTLVDNGLQSIWIHGCSNNMIMDVSEVTATATTNTINKTMFLFWVVSVLLFTITDASQSK